MITGHMLHKMQVGEDKNIVFANSALIDTQVTIDFPNNKARNSLYYKLLVYNPSTVTDLTVKVFSIESNVDSTNTRYSYITSFNIPKSQAVTGTTINMTTKQLEGLFNGTSVRLVVSNNTALGVDEGFTGVLRLKEVI